MGAKELDLSYLRSPAHLLTTPDEDSLFGIVRQEEALAVYK